MWLGRLVDLAGPSGALPAPLREPGAAFVTLHLAGRLRGCLGTVAPPRPTLAEEIVASAVLAATRDPRFRPVRPDEVGRLRYEVSLLGPLEAVRDLEDLDPAIYGIAVQGARARAVLLPGIPAIDTVARQVAAVRAKAGLLPEEPAQLYRFRTRRFVEPPAPDGAAGQDPTPRPPGPHGTPPRGSL